MVQDVLLVVGLFAWLGKPVDSVFLAALLTVVGYSVNDTVVVLDRLRSMRRADRSRPLPDLADAAVLRTLPRTVNTGMGALFILVALALLGGDSLTTSRWRCWPAWCSEWCPRRSRPHRWPRCWSGGGRNRGGRCRNGGTPGTTRAPSCSRPAGRGARRRARRRPPPGVPGAGSRGRRADTRAACQQRDRWREMLGRRASAGRRPPPGRRPAETRPPTTDTQEQYMAVSVVLFTRDLRLRDNPPLREALAAGDAVVPLFVRDDAISAAGYAVPNRRAFLADCLADLDRQLRERGSRLVVRSGDVVEQVCRVAHQAGAAEVHMSADVSAYAGRREERLAAALESAGRRLRVHDTGGHGGGSGGDHPRREGPHGGLHPVLPALGEGPPA